MPTVVIAQNTVTIPVVAGNSPPFKENLALDPRDRERWNDYGIGLLLQGDLKGAERAFETVAKLDPQYADGWVNVARARIQEGNTDAAKPCSRRPSPSIPGSAARITLPDWRSKPMAIIPPRSPSFPRPLPCTRATAW